MTTVAEANMQTTKQGFGEPLEHDPQFTGPVKSRGCTDILCLLVFVVFIVAWIVIAAFAYKNGNPERLIFPTDSEGNICGQGEFADRKHLFFFDILQCGKISKSFKIGCRTPQVCVAECPTETFVPTFKTEYLDGLETNIKQKMICKYNVDKTKKTVRQLVDDGDCAKYYLKSTSVGGRCLPVPAILGNLSSIVQYQEVGLEVNDSDGERVTLPALKKSVKRLQAFLKAQQVGAMIFRDLQASWRWILLGLLFSMVISFVWILLMRWLAGIMVWFSILVVLGLSGYACYYTTNKYVKMKADNKVLVEFNTIDDDSFTANQTTWLIFAITSGIIFGILLLVLIFLRKRIHISVALIKEGSKAVGCLMSSLFFPLLIYLVQIIILVFWGSVALYLSSTKEPVFRVVNATKLPSSSGYQDGDPCTRDDFQKKSLPPEHCMFVKYSESPYLDYLQLYNLFALFWGMFFAVGVGQVSLAGAFASYYWAFNKPKDVPTFAVAGGLARCLRYHMGSVAFGSLLLATVRMIRVILEYIEKKLKKYNENFIAKCMFWCCRCFFWCLEQFLKFINKNAYIMIAIYGKNFCSSARIAFNLLMRNIVRVVVLDKVTDFLLLIGKLVVVGFMGVVSFYFFTDGAEVLNMPKLNYIWLPITLICFGAYVIANCFFSVYNMAVDTLFLCFLEDCERNDGSPSRPYFMSKQLMKILGKRNKFLEPA